MERLTWVGSSEAEELVVGLEVAPFQLLEAGRGKAIEEGGILREAPIGLWLSNLLRRLVIGLEEGMVGAKRREAV